MRFDGYRRSDPGLATRIVGGLHLRPGAVKQLAIVLAVGLLLGSSGFGQGPGRYNWDALDRQINEILAWNPDAKLMCMIDLNTPPWWIESHDGADSFRIFGHVAAGDDYRRDAKEYTMLICNTQA